MLRHHLSLYEALRVSILCLSLQSLSRRSWMFKKFLCLLAILNGRCEQVSIVVTI